MSFDFPNSPTNGQVFAPTGGPVYVYTGGVWRMQGSGQVVTAEARNRVVNGAMQISQENGDATGGATGFYPADQWFAEFYQVPTAMTGRGKASDVLTSTHRRITAAVTTAKASFAADDYFMLEQRIEGVRIADFDWGTATAKQVVLRFMASASIAGTYTFSLRNGATNRTFLAPFTLPVLTWTLVTIVIPGDTTGTWPTDTSTAMTLAFVVGSGSAYNGVAGWQAGNKLTLPGQANGVSAASSGFNLGDVGLYLDPNATGTPPPWQMPDEEQELRACHRYWQQLYNHVVNAGANNYTTTFKATMRINPAISGGGTGFTIGQISTYSAAMYQTTAGYQILALTARM